MSGEKPQPQKPKPQKPAPDGLAARTERSKQVYRQTRNHRAAIAAYCAGNRWLEENAKVCGNLD